MNLIYIALSVASVAFATSATTMAQEPLNDDCPSPVITGIGIFPFDVNSANATDSLVPQAACAARPTNFKDVFFTWTCPSDGHYEFYTEDDLTVGYDTIMVLYDGNACDGSGCIDYDDDDGANFASNINTITAAVPGPLTAGDTYVIQVGAWDNVIIPTGTNQLTIDAVGPPPAYCVDTTYQNNNAGSAGGAVYFDLTASGSLTFDSIDTNFVELAGTPVGIEIWTIPGQSYAGQEVGGSWSQIGVDDGTAIAEGLGAPTTLNFASPVSLPAGLNAIALVAVGSSHAYTNGTGTNQNFMSTNGAITLDLGSATNVAFIGTLLTPRVWNGTLCESSGVPSVGTAFCSPSDPNSTGSSTTLTGSWITGGGISGGMSDLHLEVTDGVSGELGYFLVGNSFADPGAPVSNGYFCLASGPYYRCNVAGTTSNSIGIFDAAGVLQNFASTSSVGSGFDVPDTISGTVMVILGGSTWNFQVWHRDTPTAVGSSNFSNGLSVTF
ncbi:MAG: hypothetical protein GY930_22605 [bacterium]|nr:hypothetical protein [bacterium]